MLTYKLSLVSEEAILNLKKKVKKSALDPQTFKPRKISDIVKSLYTQFFFFLYIIVKISLIFDAFY